MRAKGRIAKALLAIMLLIAGFGFNAKANMLNGNQNSVRPKIENANYCTVSSDCELIPLTCPFGCFGYINKNEKDNVAKILNEWRKNETLMCAYGCVPPTEDEKHPICVNSKCIASKTSLN